MAYATLEELKAFLGEDGDDRDDQLTFALRAAEGAIDRFCSRGFRVGEHNEVGYVNATLIIPRNGPVYSVQSLSIEGTSHPGRSIMGGFAVARRDDMWMEGDYALTYTTVEATPAEVKQACLMTAQAMADAGALDGNLNGVQVAGVVSGGFQPGGAGSLPRGAQSLLMPLVRTICL